MSEPLTPLELEVLLHCYYRPERHPELDHSQAVSNAFYRFAAEGIIRAHIEHDHYVLTGKGRAWVQMILSTPQPRQAWIDQHGRVVEEPAKG